MFVYGNAVGVSLRVCVHFYAEVRCMVHVRIFVTRTIACLSYTCTGTHTHTHDSLHGLT